MGCCGSVSPEEQIEKQLNKSVGDELAVDKKHDHFVKKLLFLGSGGSGKSTLFKQLRTIHGEGFQDKDRNTYKDHIFSQIIEQMQLIIECWDEIKDEDPEKYKDIDFSDEGAEARDKMDNVRGDQDVNTDIANYVSILWKEEPVKEVYKERARLKIQDSSAYFFDEVKRISYRQYIPTDKDILMVRHRTTGVTEQKFKVHDTMFHVFDVGGQKSERKKWIHCFENVTAVIFVAALSCYDEVLYEDDSVNSMDDSLDLFEEICNLRWFENTNMILFLNKKDLFAKKINNTPITVCFKDYDGGDSYEETTNFIKNEFESKNKYETKQIFSHITCATDKDNVEKVFAAVQHTVISNSLQHGGLI